MPLGLGTALWAAVLPVEKTNLITNPSWEFGTATALQIETAALGTTSQFQQFGAWSLTVAPNSNGTSGAVVGTYTEVAGVDYTFSAYVRGVNGVPYMLAATDNSNGLLGSVTFTGGGTWGYYVGSYTGQSATGRRIIVRKNASANAGTFYVDGVQLEVGSATTYIDGDQAGCVWNGAPHASTSFRSGQYRGGGSVVALADLGLQVDQMLGVGVPPIEVSSQSYAVTPGAQFQRQRPAARQFTLTAKPIVGASLADFHVTRRTIYDTFKPDLVSPQQPTRLLYYGAQGTQRIDAYYQKGLELGNMDGVIAEDAAITFFAPDPYWYAPTQQGTALAARVHLGSVNFIARRDPRGQWGTLGAAGSTVFNAPSGVTAVWSIMQNSGGTIFLGGNWGTLAGTLAPHVGMYFPSLNRFGTLAGGTVEATGQLTTLAQNPAGTIFMGGNFASVAGTRAPAVARWSGAFGTLQGGTLTGPLVWDLLYSPLGTLFMAGEFDNIQGTANSRNIAMWTGAFGSLGGTTVGAIFDLAWGADNRLLLTGAFTTVKGTVGTAIAFWKSGNFGTMGGVGDGNGQWGYALGVGANGALYEGGDFTYTSGGSSLRAAVWNGVQHSALGAGLSGGVRAIVPDPVTGNVLYAGAFSSAGSINSPANYAVWNNSAWILPDILFSGVPGYEAGTVYDMQLMQDRSLYIGGNFSGTTSAAAVGTLVNVGRAQAYPTMRIRNQGAGTARIYQLVNTTTGDGIYFNYVMQPSESAVLTLQPGQRSFQSSSQGNIFGLIMPGSNLATWALAPGTNYVSYFSDGGTVETSFFWTPCSWSADGGTVF